MRVAVHSPETVLLLTPQHPLGGVDTGVGEGGPDLLAVAGHGVVEAAAPQQPEVGHPDFSRSRRVLNGPVDPPALQQVRGQAVDRLQHGQPYEERLHAPRGGGPGRVLVVVGLIPSAPACGEGRVLRPFQVGRMVMVKGKPLLEVRRQFPFRMKGDSPQVVPRQRGGQPAHTESWRTSPLRVSTE